jgi:hypothetical protein
MCLTNDYDYDYDMKTHGGIAFHILVLARLQLSGQLNALYSSMKIPCTR